MTVSYVNVGQEKKDDEKRVVTEKPHAGKHSIMYQYYYILAKR